jgi:hypothetical protein
LEIDKKSKSILSFRPNISFVEPEQQDSPISPQPEDVIPQQVEDRRIKIKNLADSVVSLAKAVQIKIDNKSKDQIIILDSGMDNAVIRALRRSYPDAANFDRITYEQYKECRDRLRDYADQVAVRSAITQDEVDNAREQMAHGKFTIGGVGTEQATNGGLRPELDDRNRLIDPLDMEEFQLDLIKLLFEMLYNMFIKPILQILPFIGGAIKDQPPGNLRPSKAMRQMSEDIIQKMDLIANSSKETRERINRGEYPLPSASSPTESQPELSNIGNPIQFQDCNLIVKTYEKGCHASMTESSVFAPMTARLHAIESTGSAISKQMDNYSSTAVASDSLSVDEQVDISFPEWLSDCIPCSQRLAFTSELSLNVGVGNILGSMLDVFEGFLTNALSQIRSLIDMFKNLDKYGDICALLDFFRDFVCVPDLAKILAILAALMMDLSFELNAIVDLALSLVVPLFLPFLIGLLDSVTKWIWLIVRPIECIIDSIQNILSKLDYNVFFQNIPNQINLPGSQQQLDTIRQKIPILGDLIPDESVTVDLGIIQRTQRAKEQAAVDKAYQNLQRLKKAANNVDASNPAAYEAYKAQESKAREEYEEAKKERDVSEITELNQQIEDFQENFNSIILQLIGFLREAVLKFQAWANGLFEEFKKLLNQYTGGTGLYFNFGLKKLALIQMIAFIKSIIDFIGSDFSCEDKNKEVESFVSNLSKESGFKVFTDENGNVYIEENIDEIDEIANALNIQNPDSLINYTGDETLDATLADTVKKLTVPSQLKVKCSLTSSVADQEKVNQWISELGSE